MGKFTKNNFLNTFNKIKEFFRHLQYRKGAYSCSELANKVAIEYYSLVKELKDLKEKGLIDMWHSKNSDGYAYNLKGNHKGEYEAILIKFFYTPQDNIKIRKEKAKQKAKDMANYGACVAIGERRWLGDLSANAIKNYEVLCEECADNVLRESFKKSFIEAINEAKSEIDKGKIYHTQKFRFPFHGIVGRLVVISLAKRYTYDLVSNEFKPPKQKSQISLVFGMNALVPLGTI
ncbi:hypothetical protein COL401_12990 [Helicobacter pylori]